MTRAWLKRVEVKKTLGTAAPAPTLDDTNRMKWKTHENFKNCTVALTRQRWQWARKWGD
jgi:hypothetical protein